MGGLFYKEVILINRNDLPPANMTCEVCGRKYRRCKTCAQMHSRGIEAWREHCDSIECYQTLVLSQMEDVSNLTREQFDRVMSFELPEGRKPVKEIADKLDVIEKKLNEKAIKEKAEAEYKAAAEKQTVFVKSNSVSNTSDGKSWKSNNAKGSYKQYDPKGKR